MTEGSTTGPTGERTGERAGERTGEQGCGIVGRPLNARSIALSILLGTHPPELPVRAFVSLAELFGIPGGTMRTALSRLVATGELTVDDGRYRLAGRQLARQRAQDLGRHEATTDGADAAIWHTIVAASDQRDVTERRRFRADMANHRFGELRPDIWMRPANLPAPTPRPDWIATSGPLTGIEPRDLVERLWDLDARAADGHRLLGAVRDLQRATDWTSPASIPHVFTVSATVVRYLRNDPLLPLALQPHRWPVPDLRLEYDTVEARLQGSLGDFLRAT